jgi:elongation factor G
MNDSASGKIVDADVPLAEMFGYATDLRLSHSGSRDLHHGVCPLLRGACNVAEGIIGKNSF